MIMTAFTRDSLTAALNELGSLAHAEGKVIDIAIYGGSALALASNFRVSTQDIDAVIAADQQTVDRIVARMAKDHDWPATWFSTAVAMFTSDLADDLKAHHHYLGSYPSGQQPGLRVFVPSPSYLLAMKLQSLRVSADTGFKDADDLKNLLHICGVTSSDEAMQLLVAFYPDLKPDSRQYKEHKRRIDSFMSSALSISQTPQYLGQTTAAPPRPEHEPDAMTSPGADHIADAKAGNWVEQWAPVASRPYLQLMRADRPIGTWLLLFPCWWGQALAEVHEARPYPNLWFLALFAIGAFVMRGAGCVYNDIVDREYDAKVARTAGRPLPSGRVTVRQAVMFMVALSLIGLLVLIQFNLFTIVLGIASIALIAIYPFMKRITDWPQAVLGLVFKWGALVGWTAVTGSLGLATLVLYAGCILWTIGYDTIYAHQDSDDDAIVGLKSTALKFGADSPRWLTGFYTGAIVLWAIAGWLAGAGMGFALALAAAVIHFAWQINTLNITDGANCLDRFRANRQIGWLLFGGLVFDMVRAGL